MERCVIYTRVSTEEESQKSAIIIQQEELKYFIKSQPNWILVDEYIDNGKTGTSKYARPEYLQLLEDMNSDKFDTIVIKDQSRLNRDEGDWFEFIKILIDTDKKLYFYLNKSYFEVNAMMLSTGIKAIMDAQYSRDLSVKLKNSHRTRIIKGENISTNGRMYGYRQIRGSKKLTLDENEADLVRYVFTRYNLGISFRKIAIELTEKIKKGEFIINKDIHKFRNSFSLTTLKRMIRNEKYKGDLVGGKKSSSFNKKNVLDNPKENWVTHKGKIEAIVDVDTWEKANGILNSKVKQYNPSGIYTNKGVKKGVLPLSGLIKCGVCGSNFHHASYSHGKQKTWECALYRELGKKGCANERLQEDELNYIVKSLIFDFWKEKDKSIDRVLNILKRFLKDDDNLKIINNLNTEMEKLENRKIGFEVMRAEGELTKERFDARNGEVDILINECKKRLENINYTEHTKMKKEARLNNISNILKGSVKSLDLVSDEILRNIVLKIVVQDSHIQVFISGVINRTENEKPIETQLIKDKEFSFKRKNRKKDFNYTADLFISI